MAMRAMTRKVPAGRQKRGKALERTTLEIALETDATGVMTAMADEAELDWFNNAPEPYNTLLEAEATDLEEPGGARP